MSADKQLLHVLKKGGGVTAENKTDKVTSCPISVPNSLLERIDHLRNIERAEKLSFVSRQSWIIDAIMRKLKELETIS